MGASNGTALSVLIAAFALVGSVEAQSSPLVHVGELRLEETDEQLVVRPQIGPDPLGGWIYWDGQANQVRLYGADGRLRSAFGREGDGPGELRRPVGAVRVESNDLVVIDATGRMSVWNADGSELRDDFNSGVARPRGLVSVGGDEVIVQGAPVPSPTGDPVPVLYRLRISDPGTAEPFFAPPLGEALEAARRIESSLPRVRNDSIFVMVPPVDSLWAVPLRETEGARSISIESEALSASPSPDIVRRDPRQFRSWVEQSTFTGPFLPLPQGGWIIQTWALRSDGTEYGLLRLDAEGKRIWELVDTAILMAVDPESGNLLLWDPEGLDPAVLQIVRERAGELQ